MPPLLLALALTLHCPTERADVKTLQDVNASAVELDDVIDTSIAWLRMVPAPEHWTETSPRYAVEEHVYRVHARLVGYKLEADSDFHVVLEDEAQRTVIVEFPEPRCAPKSLVAEEILQARNNFLSLLKRSNLPPPRAAWRAVDNSVEIAVEGVLFLDRVHGQTGVAPNGVELHPVTAVDDPQAVHKDSHTQRGVELAPVEGLASVKRRDRIPFISSRTAVRGQW